MRKIFTTLKSVVAATVIAAMALAVSSYEHDAAKVIDAIIAVATTDLRVVKNFLIVLIIKG